MSIVTFQVIVNAAWILLPLIPAILTYFVAPDKPISAEGPFNNLTIKATGAFAAYIITLLIAYPLINNQNEVFARVIESEDAKNAARKTWMITGSVLVQDEHATQAPFSDQDKMEVTLDPNIIRLDQQRRQFEIIVPEIDRRIPIITVRYPGYGSTSINPEAPSVGEMVLRNDEQRKVEITSPLLIRRAPCKGLSC